MRFIGAILAVLYLAGCSNASEEVSKNTQPPATPGAIKAAGSGNTVELQWPASNYAESYTVYWSYDNTAALTDWQSATGIKTPAFTLALTEQVAVVYVRISAGNRYGESSPGPVLTRVLPPTLSATEGNAKVGLRWPRAEGVSYTVYWSNQSGINKSIAMVIPDVQSEPYLHENLSNDLTYYYFVTARIGADESDPSNIVAATPNTRVKHAPLLSTPDTLDVEEKQAAVVKLQAADEDGDEISYTIAAGLDKDLFTLNTTSGELAFSAAWTPDFEWPQDANGDNVYQVTVRAGDGIEYDERILKITVRDVLDDRVAPEVNAAAAKLLHFSWTPLRSATHFKFYQDADGPKGPSGYSQLGGDLTSAEYTMDVAVHRLDWVNASYFVEACNSGGVCFATAPVSALSAMVNAIGYVKSSNTGAGDNFGVSIALSADGNTLAVGAYREDSAAMGVGVGGNMAAQTDDCLPIPDPVKEKNCARDSGAVYVYTRSGTNPTWTGPVYIKASNNVASNNFGGSVALSADGNTLAVGAIFESSASKGVGGEMKYDCSVTPRLNCANGSGAVYVYSRFYNPDGTNSWTGPVYIKASNTDIGDNFGVSVALSASGNTLAVGARGEDSAAVGVGGNTVDQTDLCSAPTPVNCARNSGAVYVYSRVYNFDRTNYWTGPVYIKASNTGAGKAFNTGDGDYFGQSVALSADGKTLAIGAYMEDSAARGVGGNAADQTDLCSNTPPVNCAIDSGAVYVYNRGNTNPWTEPVVYIKAPNTGAFDHFGWSVTLNTDGSTLAVGAYREDGATSGVSRNTVDQTNFCSNIPPVNCATDSGAVYVYSRGGTNSWTEPAVYIKASNTGANNNFGRSVALSADGNTLAVGADKEDSGARGVGGTIDCLAKSPPENCAQDSGAVYVYSRVYNSDSTNYWTGPAYIKASNTGAFDIFGWSVALSANGNTLAVGAYLENSAAVVGVGGSTADQTDRCAETPPANCASDSGAVYLY